MNKLGILLIALCTTFTFPETVEAVYSVENDLHSENITSSLEYIYFTDNDAAFNQVLRTRVNWKNVSSDFFNAGYTSRTYWFRLPIKYSSDGNTRAFLEIDRPVLDKIDMYIPGDKGTWKEINTGDRRPFGNRSIQTRTFAFPISITEKTSTVYFRIATRGRLNFKLYAHSPAAFIKENITINSLLSIFYGILFFIGIYHLIIYLSSREGGPQYLYFSLFSLGSTIFLASINGSAYQYLWPSSPWFANRSDPTFGFTMLCFAGLFFNSFLKTKETTSRKIQVLFTAFSSISAIMIIIHFFLNFTLSVTILNIFFVILSIGTLTITLYYSFHKNTNAKYLLIGFLPIFIMVPIQVLSSYGIISSFFLTEWKVELSFMWLMLTSSLGLANTINKLNRKLNTSRDQLEKNNIYLNEKNQELNAAMEELEATNEEFEAQNEELLRAYWDLEQNELRYRSIVEDQTEFITRWDPGGIITFANRAYCREFGLEPENMVGKSFFEFIPEDFHAQVWVKIHSLTPEHPVKVDEHRVIRGDGSTAWHQWIDRAFFDDYGNPTGYQSVGRDITEKKETEIALRRLATTVEQASEDIIITDTEGTIQYVNPAFEKITGYSRDEVIGQKPSIINSGVHSHRFYEDLWETIEAGKTWTGHITNKRKDGEYIHEESVIFPIIDDYGNILNFAAIKRDITEQINLEEQLLQAQKMEAIGTLVGGLAHDFNNVLGGIIGSVEILDILLNDQKLNNADEVWSYINTIRDSSDRAVEMIKQLLSLSRRQEMEKKHFDLNESLEHVLNICKNSFPKSVFLDFRFTDDPCFVYADQTRIEQVILNMCVNASQAMTIMRDEDEGGTLSVSLSVVERKTAEDLELPFACITVSDDGIGMDDDVKAHMFEPFFTTKEKEMGTGLGLSMVYNIVKQHQGIIDVDSTPGRGTSVELFLPVAGDNDNQATAEKKSMAVHSGSGVVLVVDDEKPIRKIASGILENAGYRVLTAENGDEAITLFKVNQDTIDVVLLDMSMPVMSGLDVYTALRKINPSIKVLVTSGFGLDAKVQKILDLGASGFIAKPFSTDKLTAKILQVIES